MAVVADRRCLGALAGAQQRPAVALSGPFQGLDAGWAGGGAERRHVMALPAYDQCIKASHVFNLLDARGVISVTERQSYILRVRELAKACGEAWLATEAGGAAVGATP